MMLLVTPEELAALKAYLSDDTAEQWSDAELARTYLAERVDQLNRVRLPRDEDGQPFYPTPLLEALQRRVARNLAMRKVPLGIAASADGLDVSRVGAVDPEIRRLENPYRRMVV
jgi:hypothetical protein